jgi:hypothetical protein
MERREPGKKKRYGRCRICARFRQLTREHVPPASAFNDRGYLQHYIDEVRKSELLQWQTKEVNANGIYVFSLCEECNNKTGQRYGSAYLEFVTAFCSVAQPNNANISPSVNVSIFPARVLKQAVSMILSTSNAESFRGYEPFCNPLAEADARRHFASTFAQTPDLDRLRTVYDELGAFVRRRDSKGLPLSVRLYAYVVANEGAGVRTGIFATGRISRKSHFWGVVVGLWPIHWVLILDGEPDEELLDVTHWANFSFKDRITETLKIPCHWAVGKYPLDFRSPEEIVKTRFTAMMTVEGLRRKSGQDKEQRFQDALNFARRKGERTSEGLLMSEFKNGTYFEAKGQIGWLDGLKRDEAREFLKGSLLGSNEPAHSK